MKSNFKMLISCLVLTRLTRSIVAIRHWDLSLFCEVTSISELILIILNKFKSLNFYQVVIKNDNVIVRAHPEVKMFTLLRD